MNKGKGNILITSAGRRAALVQSFIKTLDEKGIPGKVYTADRSPGLSAACQLSDGSYQLPGIGSKGYKEALFSLCHKLSIQVLIPTIDPELPYFSEWKEDLKKQGTAVLISASSLVADCSDKFSCKALFAGFGVPTPETYTQWPGHTVFARPRYGSGSIHAQVVHSKEQFNWLAEHPDNFIFNAYINQGEYHQYTVDTFFSEGRLCAAVPRKRLEIRAGETSKGITDKGPVYNFIREHFSEWPLAEGPVGIQIFFNAEGNSAFGIEVNPRFSGAYPLTERSGAYFVSWIIDKYILGRTIPFYEGWKDALCMLRYDQEVYL